MFTVSSSTADSSPEQESSGSSRLQRPIHLSEVRNPPPPLWQFIHENQIQHYRTALNYMTGLWAIVQMACSMLCCCAITYKPILPGDEFFSRLASYMTRSGSLSYFRSSNVTQPTSVHHSENTKRREPGASTVQLNE